LAKEDKIMRLLNYYVVIIQKKNHEGHGFLFEKFPNGPRVQMALKYIYCHSPLTHSKHGNSSTALYSSETCTRPQTLVNTPFQANALTSIFCLDLSQPGQVFPKSNSTL
jgi:hypothetical protein